MSDDKTPTGLRPIEVSDSCLALAAAGIALGTAATQLENAAGLVRGVALQCAEASRLVDDYAPADRSALLRDLEERLGALADDIHETRRKVRANRLALEDTDP